jgi:hypothetical protein
LERGAPSLHETISSFLPQFVLIWVLLYGAHFIDEKGRAYNMSHLALYGESHYIWLLPYNRGKGVKRSEDLLQLPYSHDGSYPSGKLIWGLSSVGFIP